MLTRFNAQQTVEIPVPEQSVPIQHYLRQPQRLVYALTDPSRVEGLRPDVFRLKMRPLALELGFVTFRLQPTVDMRVWAETNGTVHLRAIGCEIRGLEYVNQRFHLDLLGKLTVIRQADTSYLQGRADLEVMVELPPPLWLTPPAVLEMAGNGLLKSVLLTIKQRLLHHLLQDYQRWAIGQGEASETSADIEIQSTLAAG